ncbi:hypothetical protein [Mycolicibacterium moriokaense]|uniref:Uncharacterized protein n=1 Tax=Mycolicibacterium moriokaense TaxID=39691 RepID=A0A318HDF7_9MYCO|nr:hypothetical protein [Mycolicibacterium moriokaense]PXX06374.1 hypothetical protein C8E89_114147 [Mycolicibacterium moriokaense]
MAIITSGSLADFSITPTDGAYKSMAAADEIDSFGVLAEVTRDAPADLFKFDVSAESRGLGLASLRLEKGFQNFLARLFNKTSDIYFLAWCWDMSGAPATVYPDAAAAPTSVLIPMEAGQVRQFMGAGVLLFPARPVTAGLAVRIQIWESAQGTRDFGKTLSAVADVIQKSKLNSLLTMIGMVTGVATATVALVEQAALELGKAVGDVLQASSDDYVDFYEGYFPAAEAWNHGDVAYPGRASEINLNRF